MEPNEIHQSIAQQIDHMKPAHLKPGKDIAMQVLDADTLRVAVMFEPRRVVDVRYDASPDTYTVTVHPNEPVSDVYCDQLGELVFGDEAKAWTQPFGGISVQNPDGSWTQVSEF